MTERMSDEELGRAIDEAGSSIPKDAINPETSKPFGTGNVPAMHAAMGAEARRLVHEDLRMQIDRLTAERDALQAEKDQYESPAWAANERLNEAVERLVEERDAALGEIEIWKSVFPDIAPDQVMPDRAQAEAEAFRAGAEAMRRKAAWLLEPKNDKSDWTPYAADCHRHAEAVRALPLPAHQSSTQTGTSPTTGHSCKVQASRQPPRA